MGSSELQVNLPLSGVLNIENSAETALLLSDAINKSEKLAIDLSGVRELDLPGIQLLYSASRTAANKGRSLVLTGSIAPEAIRKLLHAGFIQNTCSSGEALMAMLPDFFAAGSKTC